MNMKRQRALTKKCTTIPRTFFTPKMWRDTFFSKRSVLVVLVYHNTMYTFSKSVLVVTNESTRLSICLWSITVAHP